MSRPRSAVAALVPAAVLLLVTSARGASPVRAVTLPEVVDVPYVLVHGGASRAWVEVRNDTDLPATGPEGGKLLWSVDGDSRFRVLAAPTTIAAHKTAHVTVQFDGSAEESLAVGQLSVHASDGLASTPLFAAAGSAELGPSAWRVVNGAGGVVAGYATYVSMPTAPFPYTTGPWQDSSVYVFIPEGHRERVAQDLLVHFHGWYTHIADTLELHKYPEHLYASGADDILIIPQGPYDAASGDFGKLLQPGGLQQMLNEVLIMLYRDGRTKHPVLGHLTLASHSGGFLAAAANLAPEALAPPVSQVNLFDSIYNAEDLFASVAEKGGYLRSVYTPYTASHNAAIVARLKGENISVSEALSQPALRDDNAVMWQTDADHWGSTWADSAYEETLRWTAHHTRHGPRIELRHAVCQGGQSDVRWLSPHDDDLAGFRVETSTDLGATYKTIVEVGAGVDHTTFPCAGERVRIWPEVTGLKTSQLEPSDTYRMDNGADIIVVDGFDRDIGGSYGLLHHDFAATVGEAAGKVAVISNEALTEDHFDPSAYKTMIWVLGDESTADRTFTLTEQQVVTDFLAHGGRVLVSGANVAYDLGNTAGTVQPNKRHKSEEGTADGAWAAQWLADTFGATYVADGSGSLYVKGVGHAASTGVFLFGGSNAPYQERDPDVLGTTGDGEKLLVYGTNTPAAVGLANRAVLAAFPLELINGRQTRAKVVHVLLQFLGVVAT